MAISRVPKIAAKRRLTYLGHSPKPQISDHIHPIMDPQAVSFFTFHVISSYYMYFSNEFYFFLASLCCRVSATKRDWKRICAVEYCTYYH